MFVLKAYSDLSLMRAYLGGEAPVHAHRITMCGSSAIVFHLATQGLPVWNATLQALSSQHSDLYLRHIQPTDRVMGV